MSDFQDKQSPKQPCERCFSMQWCYMTIFAFVFITLCCGLLLVPLKIAIDEVNHRIDAVEVFLIKNYKK